MPKEWLLLPEAERLTVEITDSDAETVRASILEGARNLEFPTSGRGENGHRVWKLPGAAWAQEPDWETSHLHWFPCDPDRPSLLARVPWGTFLIGLIHRVSLERYLAPAGAPISSPIRAGKLGGRPRKYDRDAAYIECIRLANMPDGLPDDTVLKKHLTDWFAERDEYPSKSTLDEIVSKIRSAR